MRKFPLQAYLYVADTIYNEYPEFQKTVTDFILSLFPPTHIRIKMSELIKDLEAILKIKIQIADQTLWEDFEIFIDKDKILKLITLIMNNLKNSSQKIINTWLIYERELDFSIPSLKITTTCGYPYNRDVLYIEGLLPIPLDFINDCWCLLTNGGKINFSENQVILNFSGLRNIYGEKFYKSEYLEIAEEIKNYNIKTIKELREKYIKDELISLKDIFNEISHYTSNKCNIPLPSEILIDSNLPLIFDSYSKWSAIFLIILAISKHTKDLKHLVLQISYRPMDRKIEINNVLVAKNLSKNTELTLQRIAKLIKLFQCENKVNIKKWRDDTEIQLSFHLNDNLGIYLDEKIPDWEYLSSESKEIFRRICHNYNLPEQHPFLCEIFKFEVIQTFMRLLEKPILINISTELLKELNKGLSPEVKKFLERVSKQKVKRSDLDTNLIASFFEILCDNPKYLERLKSHFNLEEITREKLNELTQYLKLPHKANIKVISEICKFVKEFRS